MSNWTDADIRRHVHHLRSLQQRVEGPRPVIPEGCVYRLDRVEQKLLDALRRDHDGPANDGYPTGSSDTGRRGGAETSTSVETAALNQLEHGNPEDPHHTDTINALTALADLDDALRRLYRALDSIDHRRQAPSRHSNPGGECIVCGRWVEGTADDPIRRGMCDKDRKAWERAGRPELEWYVVDPDAPPDQRIERARWVRDDAA